MRVAVLNGTLSEAEQAAYVRRVTAKYPVWMIEKLILDVQGDYVDISRFRCFVYFEKILDFPVSFCLAATYISRRQ